MLIRRRDPFNSRDAFVGCDAVNNGDTVSTRDLATFKGVFVFLTADGMS